MTRQRIRYIQVSSLEQSIERQLRELHWTTYLMTKRPAVVTPGCPKSARAEDALVAHSMKKHEFHRW
jgi:hypothetical protein